MRQSDSSNHQLLIQKLLVSIHYLTLFRDEIILVEKTPSLLGDEFSRHVIQLELGDILTAVDALSTQEKLIKSTFWYEEDSFKLMNHSLDIVGTWVRGIDHILEMCESKSVFQAILGDNGPYVFGVLTDVFASLKVTNLSIVEESSSPILFEGHQLAEDDVDRQQTEELLSKIDAEMSKYNSSSDDEIEETIEIPTASKSDMIKLFRHYLFDNNDNLVYLIDAGEELSDEITFYNAFNRFNGTYGSVTNALILIEGILADLERQSQGNFDKDGNIIIPATKPIYLMIYGENQLAIDSRFTSLMAELDYFSSYADLHVIPYKAYYIENS